ncbi:hypothetical protein LY78DRAFT_169611 [Colletotrichum sublineola]|nr:hypothetical protein LY78DRAFT_169611 [Colletotrichum sublineola]
MWIGIVALSKRRMSPVSLAVCLLRLACHLSFIIIHSSLPYLKKLQSDDAKRNSPKGQKVDTVGIEPTTFHKVLPD